MNFSQKELKNIAIRCSKKIHDAKLGLEYFETPYKHLVIDDFFDLELANQCLQFFPDLADEIWEYENDTDIEIKYRTK